jgi:OPA family glycerol-3-phosphate transporter-like MFS transporter
MGTPRQPARLDEGAHLLRWDRMIFSWFKPPPHRPRRPPAEVDRLYPRYRWQIFESAFVAYALFYIVRNNFAPVSKEIGEALQYTKPMIGDILAGTAIAYGVGKFVMGYFSDKSDSRKYIAVGMLLTAALNFLFGGTANYRGHLMLWTLNGFVQGMGYGPCSRGLSHWFSVGERGKVFGAWNISHNIGGGIAGWLAALCAGQWGWRSAFYVPGLIATLGAVYLFWRVRDTPQSQGLPPIEEYKNDWPPDETERHERELSFKEMFLRYILPNKRLWVLAFANVFVYIARYAMVDWGPTYLKEIKGASLAAGGFSTLVIEFSGAAGMLTMGWLSDKLGGRRARVSVMAMIPLMLAFAGLIFTGSLLLKRGDVTDAAGLVRRLQAGSEPVAAFVWRRIPADAQRRLADASRSASDRQALLQEELNRILKGESIYNAARFAGVRLRDETRALLERRPAAGRDSASAAGPRTGAENRAPEIKGSDLVYLNRLLLEDAFPADIVRCRFTPAELLGVNLALFAVIGFLVYTPVMFSGVMALDLTSKKAAATAPGFVGLFGYVGGRVLQGKGLGVIAQHYGWDAGLYAIIGCTFLGTVLLAMLWNARPRG